MALVILRRIAAGYSRGTFPERFSNPILTLSFSNSALSIPHSQFRTLNSVLSIPHPQIQQLLYQRISLQAINRWFHQLAPKLSFPLTCVNAPKFSPHLKCRH
jgi:hypothetical protein